MKAPFSKDLLAARQAQVASLQKRVAHLEQVIRTIYWAVQDESDTQAIAVYIEQEAQVDLDAQEGGKE